MTILGKKIIELRNKGYSYNKIMKSLSCSKGTISYYLGDKQKEKTIERRKKLIAKPEFVLQKKIQSFKYRESPNKKMTSKVRDFQRRDGSKLSSKQEDNFSYKDFLKKIGNNPKCYLSGEPINLFETKTYSIDHIVPATKGGDNTLDNAGLISSSINKMKSDIEVDVFIQKCIKILKYNGYKVVKRR